MGKIKISKDLVLRSCNSHVAKSRFFDVKWIHRKTGQKMNTRQVTAFISYTVRAYCTTKLEKTLEPIGAYGLPVLLSALDDFDPLTSKDVENITIMHRPWHFFETYFKGREGMKISTIAIYDQFKTAIGDPALSHKAFYQYLKEWAEESGYRLHFKNTLANRKVILEK